jgi:hypothetical protein
MLLADFGHRNFVALGNLNESKCHQQCQKQIQIREYSVQETEKLTAPSTNTPTK